MNDPKVFERLCAIARGEIPGKPMNTIDLWKSRFGDEYTVRNAAISNGARVCLWKEILPRKCKSVLEVGANVGQNLEAISQISDCQMYACEPNEFARTMLAAKGTCKPSADTADNLSWPTNSVDLVFTSGVLIHIGPDKLSDSMSEIHRVARKWIVCGEYFAPSEEMVPYRGHEGAMWRRDYGSLWLDNFPDLKCTMNLFAWKRMTGLDNLMFWVFEKQ